MRTRRKMLLLLALLLTGGIASAQVTIKGSVFGGGKLGDVSQNTTVTINDGTTEGSIYGGGMGSGEDETKGIVKGNTEVQMKGGHVELSVYGGGLLGSVGTFTAYDTINAIDTLDNPVVVYVPKTCAPSTGKAKVVLEGGRVGLFEPLMPTSTDPGNDYFGYVFCGGQGEADSIKYPHAIASAVVDNTELEIKGSVVITASAYGGSENGLVLHDTYVKMSGGQIGTGHYMSGGEHHYVGAYDSTLWVNAINAVKSGNATAINNIAEDFYECHAWDYDSSNYHVYDIFANPSGNYPNGTSSGGGSSHSTNGHSFFGNLFGGGSGYYPIRPGVWRRTAGQVRGNVVVDIEGGHILTCVYGGNEYTDVLGKVTVNMSDGTVGVPRKVEHIQENPVTCMLFGAGMGDPRTAFNTWNNVNEVEVNITGGTIFGSIYGGGEDGHVLGDVNVNVSDSAFIGIWGTSNYDGNIFGAGRGFYGQALTAGTVGGNVNVNVDGGNVLGTVYGGGRLASVGTHLVDVNVTGYGQLQDGEDAGYITVNVNGGTIGHNVFGGSMGRIKNIDGTENSHWPRLAMAKQTKVNVKGGTIGQNVYGGSEYGSVRDSAIVIVDSISGVVAPIISGSVYGGGFGSLDYEDQGNDSTAHPALMAGRVQGNTLVKVNKGTIKHNVYGGGELASVGLVKDNLLKKGITNVIITGGTIGLDTINLNANQSPYYSPSGFVSRATADGGNVYGGSKGVNSDPEGHYNAYGNVNHTRVTIGGTGKVWGSVYGGSADGHVLGNDSVFITSTKRIGTQGTSGWDGNVFAGGKGNNTNPTAGRVGGNTFVTMDNGQVLGNIYGGGRLSLVGIDEDGVMQDEKDHGYTKVRMRGGILGNNTKTGSGANDPQVIEIYSASSMGSIYGGGKGDINGLNGHHPASALLVGMVKNTEVEVSDTLGNNTHVYGIVFGGGEVANVGKYTWHPNATYGAQDIQITEGLAKINISGGIIGGDRAKMRYEKDPYSIYPKYNDDLGYVYGGGEGISDDPDNYAKVMESTSPQTLTSLVDLMATVYETEVTISGGWVKGSVFGGGEAGHVRENTLVTISGGQIGAGDDGTADVLYTNDDPFINPTTTPITNSLYGTTHWPFGKTVGSEVVYTPYDPVYVANGQEPSDGKSWFGNVFGGGSGWFPYIKEEAGQPESHWNPLSGKVWGNTHVVIDGGHVLNNVYGGNEATDIGGKATVEIKGGTVGVPRTKEQIIAQPCSGYVFGGGCGDPRTDFDAITVVDSTNVKVTGGIIYGSVYGGAEDGHVLGDTRVTVKQDPGKTTVIGCEGLSTADGNIFGGGRNFLGENLKAGRVEGNIYVTMTSGTIQGSIFGGGRQALSGIDEDGNFPASGWTVADHGNVTINVSGTAELVNNGTDTVYSTVIGNSHGRDLLCGSEESVGDIFGSGKGDTKNYDKILNGNVTNTTITITGSPRIYGGVFGGGEMASVGYLIGDDTIANTGVTSVNVGSTDASESQYLVIGTPLEYTKSYMNDHPSEWTIYELINGTKRVEHTCTGNVYGGSQGNVDITKPNWIKMARSNRATVTINSGNILSSVFGGPEQGTMKGNASVIINGGTIGQTGLIDNDDNTYSFGGVYGGGYGSDNTVEHHNALANDPSANGPLAVAVAGRVYGTATVTVNGGTIRENVFGGGEMATVDGNTTVNFYKGTVGPIDRLDSDSLSLAGNVYGGGKGLSDEKYKQYCNVDTATVIIGNNNNYDIAIQGDVYGGGADAHVLGNTFVTITGTNTVIGTNGVTNLDGNVFGGGRGSGYLQITDSVANADTTFILNPTCGRVAGNITLTMDKGTLKGSIFGGGRLALAGIDVNGDFVDKDHGNVKIEVTGGTIGTSDCEELLKCDVSVGDIFGSGKGDIEWYDAIMAGRVTNTQISVTGNTTVHGCVFGGGEMAGIGYRNGSNAFIDDTGESTITIGTVGGTSANSPTIGSLDEFFYTKADNPGEWTMYDDEEKIFHTCTGNVFGGSQGDVDLTAPNWVSMASSKTSNVTINSGTIRGSVFGGSEQGTVIGNTHVTVKGGKIGTYINDGSGASHPYSIGDVYGAGYGSDDSNESNFATPDSDSTAMALALAGRVYGNTVVDMLGGKVKGSVFGGSEFAYVGGTTVNVGDASSSVDSIGGSVYGGNNRDGVVIGSTNVNINSGNLGNNTGNRTDVFGGGYGEHTGTQGDVIVTVGDTLLPVAPTIYGDVYGGSAYGTVNDNLGNDTTYVNIVKGIIRRTTTRDDTYGGDVYGGGLGITDDTQKGNVNGVIQVNVGQMKELTTTSSTNTDSTYYNYTGLATIDHNVYGCNNTGGYPLENVHVNIFGTAHTDGTNGTPDNTLDGDAFALNDVFGGGNYADNIATDKTLYVNVFGCDNTIKRVFGGSDASAAPNVSTDIQGGRIDQAFGGGNGEHRAANINGNANLAIHGGEIAMSFAGSNQNGVISGTQNVTVDNNGPCQEILIDEFFCGGNKVDVYGDVDATITCSDGMNVRNIYGGCNLADIKKYPTLQEIQQNPGNYPAELVAYLENHTDLYGTGGNVNLTICGGTYQNVYGGSKGDLAALNSGTETGHTDHLVTIEGNVTVNIEGGTIDTLFGGCNIYGDIYGKITVNVNDANSASCPLILHNVYGGGRNAGYHPTEYTGSTPEVNILNGTVSKDNGSGGNVFGGGFGMEKYGLGGGDDAIITANPKVTIGGSNTSTHNATIEGNVYGGGHGAKIVGNPHVILDGTSIVNVEGNVYGGGSQAVVDGNAKVEIKEPTTQP